MALTSQQQVIRKYQITLSLLRPGAETRSDGIPTRAAGTPQDFIAHIQPLTPQEIRHLPEGEDARNWRNVWVIDGLNAVEPQINDEITDPDDGQTLIVQKVEHWREGGFRKAQCLRRAGTL